MIANINKNRMGTTSFMGKFGKMRKEQSFVVYPIHSDMNGETITIQSEHRFAIIKVESGATLMSANHAQYANTTALQMDIINGKAERFTIEKDALEPLLAFIRGTAGAMVGNNGMRVFTDNSNANLVGV
jgi:hypothetical protein